MLLTLLLALATPAHAGPVDVWLDVDTSTGVTTNGRAHDVDDGLFMIQAFNSPELHVRGVSVQFGNASLEQAMPIAEDVLERFGPRGLVAHAGAASADDLGRENGATRALADALRDRPLHVLAVGPVTNVASVLMLEPDLAGQMQSIIVVAARRDEQWGGFRFGPPQAPDYFFPDANFEKDVAGMQVLLDSGVPLVFAGYEVSSDVWLTPDHLDALADASDAGRWISQTSQGWMNQWLDNLGTPGFNPFDTLANLWLTHPHLMKTVPVTVSIIQGLDEQASQKNLSPDATKPYLVATPDDASPHLYLTTPDASAIDVIVERLASRPAAE